MSPSPSAWIHAGANTDWEAEICCQRGFSLAGAVQMKSLGVEAGKKGVRPHWSWPWAPAAPLSQTLT